LVEQQRHAPASSSHEFLDAGNIAIAQRFRRTNHNRAETGQVARVPQ
jgi:hypothetical protein